MRDIRCRILSEGGRRDVLIEEIVSLGSTVSRIRRRCTYRVDSIVGYLTLGHLIQDVKESPFRGRVRQVYVTKALLEKGGERVVYKVLGEFLVVLGTSLFDISYRHTLSMEVGV